MKLKDFLKTYLENPGPMNIEARLKELDLLEATIQKPAVYENYGKCTWCKRSGQGMVRNQFATESHCKDTTDCARVCKENKAKNAKMP